MNLRLLSIAMATLLIGLSTEAAQVSDFLGEYKLISGNNEILCQRDINIQKSVDGSRSFECNKAEILVKYNDEGKDYGLMAFCNINQGVQKSFTAKDEHGSSSSQRLETTLADNILKQALMKKEYLWGLRIPFTAVTKSTQSLILNKDQTLTMTQDKAICQYSKK